MSFSNRSVKIGILGLGNMGSLHARCLLEGSVPEMELVAVADHQPAKAVLFPQVPFYSSADALWEHPGLEAVLIATPHFDHAISGIAALQRGLHVLVEKPLTVHKLEAENLLAAQRDPRQVFGVMLNQRTTPAYQKVRQLVQSGALGQIHRIQWTITDWFRTEAYYASGDWRASWRGEGGGVLLNQSPHQLDLWQWMFGLPQRVRAFCQFGRFHAIEVEDAVTAYLEYADGCTGVFITTTGEAPGSNRLEIAADHGRLVVEDHTVHFLRNEIPVTTFLRTAPGGFSKPPVWDVRIPGATGAGSQHQGILQNFARAVLWGEELLAPAREGIHAVELANAMLASTFTEQTITLPLSSQEYATLLQKKMETSTYLKPMATGRELSDFAASF